MLNLRAAINAAAGWTIAAGLCASSLLRAEEPTPAASAPKASFSGRIRAEYDFRQQGDSKDHDLYGRLHADGRDLAGGTLDTYISARLEHDLDGKAPSPNFADDPFYSLSDAGGVTENRILQAYADWHSRDKVASLRAGRQYVEIADYLQLDGAQALYNEAGQLGLRVYAGHPVSYYTAVSGDFAGGLSLVGRPWEGNLSRITWSKYHDDSESNDDDNFYLDLRQRFEDYARMRGQLSVLNDEFRMGRLDGGLYSPDGDTDLTLGASYWGSFDAKTRAYSPLYNTLGEQEPYTYSYLRLHQRISPSWTVSPGVALRITEKGDFSNRDYENYDVTFVYEPNRSFSGTLGLEYWSVENEDSFAGISGELRYRHGRAWEISGGASFAEYTYDTYSDFSYSTSGGQAVLTDSGTVIEETPYVYTYFLRGKWRVSDHVTLRLQGDIEDDDAAQDVAYRGRGSVEVRF